MVIVKFFPWEKLREKSRSKAIEKICELVQDRTWLEECGAERVMWTMSEAGVTFYMTEAA